MRTFLRFALLIPAAFVLSAPSKAAKFEPDGRVVIAPSDLTADGDEAEIALRATRWGMYQLQAKGAKGLTASVNGAGPVKKGSGANLGTFYIAKAGKCVIAVSGKRDGLESLTLVPACEGTPVVQEAGKAIDLDAKHSRVEGVMLRYEPNPKKLCLGFWGNPKDSPVWEFTVTTAGTYEVILTQGCGRGAGGSKAEVQLAGEKLPFTVVDTGGWQSWKDVSLGKVTFEKAGAQSLRVKVLKKARGIMDIRRIVLKPVAK